MSVFDLADDETVAAGDQHARENPVVGPADATWGQGVGTGIGQGIMRGGVASARAGYMAAAGAARLVGIDPTPIFASMDEVTDKATDYWTPSAADVGTVGKVLGGFGEMVLPLMAGGGNPALLVEGGVVAGERRALREGVTPETAEGMGLIEGAAAAAGFRLPFLGNTLSKRIATGVAGNVALGAATRGGEHAMLSDQPEIAGRYLPGDTTSIAIDALTGAAFGGVAHLHMRESDRQAIAAAANAKHYQQDSAPGIPADTATSIEHQARMDSATEQLLRSDDPVVVDPLPPDAAFVPRETAPLDLPDEYLHGTTPENAAAILAAGRFDPHAGERQYDYSQFGRQAVYFTAPDNKFWLDREMALAGRAVPYDAQVRMRLDPSARVRVVHTVEDLDALAREVGMRNGVALMRKLSVDGLQSAEQVARAKSQTFDEFVADHLTEHKDAITKWGDPADAERIKTVHDLVQLDNESRPHMDPETVAERMARLKEEWQAARTYEGKAWGKADAVTRKLIGAGVDAIYVGKGFEASVESKGGHLAGRGMPASDQLALLRPELAKVVQPDPQLEESPTALPRASGEGSANDMTAAPKEGEASAHPLDMESAIKQVAAARPTDTPEQAAIRERLAVDDVQVPIGRDDDGNVVTGSAREIMAASDVAVAEAQAQGKAYDAAVNCFITRGSE